MSHLKNSQQGFGAVEAILIVVTIALIGIVGLFVYKHYHKTTVAINNPSCGTLSLSAENGAQFFLQQTDYDKLKSCFYNSYKSHKSTSITVHLMVVDTGSTDTYAIKGSTIEHTAVSYSANFGGSQHTSTASCSNMVERLGGIVLSCNDGDVLYSPDNSPQVDNSQI